MLQEDRLPRLNPKQMNEKKVIVRKVIQPDAILKILPKQQDGSQVVFIGIDFADPKNKNYPKLIIDEVD